MGRLKFYYYFILIIFNILFNSFFYVVKSSMGYDVHVANEQLDEDQTHARVAVLACANNDLDSLPNVFFNLNQNKWTTSKHSVECIESLSAVYQLCKKLYPNQLIENIVQSNNQIDFEVYDGNRLLGKQSGVRPYVCLYGQYKSIALNVPVGCEFKHVYDENRCETEDHWLKSAQDKCETTGQHLNRSYILQWCGSNSLNKFMGIQYVCCSGAKSTATPDSSIQIIDNDTYDLNDVYSLDSYDDEYEKPLDKPSNEVVVSPDKPIQSKPNGNVQSEDGLKVFDGDLDEQARYASEQQNITESYAIKSRLMVNQWHRERDANKNDADRLHDVDKLYNQRLQVLDEDKQRLLMKSELAHSDIVERILNENKMKAKTDLDSFKLKPNLLGNIEMLRNLAKNFIESHEADRLHQLTLYKRLNVFNLLNDKALTNIKTQIVGKLRDLNKTIEAKLIELKQLGQYKAKLEASLTAILGRYASQRTDAAYIVDQYDLVAKQATTDDDLASLEIDDIDKQIDLEEDDYVNSVQETMAPTRPVVQQVTVDDNKPSDTVESIKTSVNVDLDSSEDLSIDDDYDDDSSSVEYSDSDLDDESNGSEQNQNKDEYKDSDLTIESIIKNGEPQLNSGSLNKFNTNGQDLEVSSHGLKTKYGSMLVYSVIGLCVVVLFILLGIAVVVRKRHMHSGGHYTNSYRPLDQDQYRATVDEKLTNREERYVNQMQIHGFVNPMTAIAEKQSV